MMKYLGYIIPFIIMCLCIAIGLPFSITMIILLVSVYICIHFEKSSDKIKLGNKAKTFENNKDVLESKDFLKNYELYTNQSEKYLGNIKAFFNGYGGINSELELYGFVTNKIVVILSKDAWNGEISLIYCSELPDTKSEFYTYTTKKEGTATRMMNVEKSAMVGYAASGLGGGAYNAYKAAETNANGGLSYSTKYTTSAVGFKSGDFNMSLDRFYIYDKNSSRFKHKNPFIISNQISDFLNKILKKQSVSNDELDLR